MADREEKQELLEALEALVDIVEDEHYKCELDLLVTVLDFADEDCWIDEADNHAVIRRARQAIVNAKGGA